VSQPSLRAAVIGLGRHGFRHLQAYQRIEALELAAVCDVRADQVAAVLKEYQGVKGYTDWKELLQNERLDLVSVVTNGPSHASITIAAAEHGVKHVMCEKPMATSVKDALAMIRMCSDRGTRLAVCHGRRWVKGYKDLRDLIANGLIGKPGHFSFTCGGGLFAGNGTHIMDLVRFLSGSNASLVIGFVDKADKPNPRGADFKDPGAVALYFFDNGSRFIIDMCDDIGVSQRFEIVGDKGRVLFDELEGRWEVTARPNENGSNPVTPNWWDLMRPVPFEPVVLDMVEMVRNGLQELLSGEEITCTGEDGLAALEMAIGAHVSSRKGSARIQLPLAEEYRQIDIPFT